MSHISCLSLLSLQGFAYGLGICAIHHQEDVISILEEYQNYVDELSNKGYLMEGAEVQYFVFHFDFVTEKTINQ